MSYKITKRENEKVELIDIDETGDTYVIVRRAVGKDELSLQQLETSTEYSYTIRNSKISERIPVPRYVSNARKVWLTMVDCNILAEDGTKYFTPDTEWKEFLENKWGELDGDLQDSIFDAIVKVNPHWGN